MINRLSTLAFILVISLTSYAQETDSAAKEEARLHNLNLTDSYLKRKGKMFASWGYNRSATV